MRSCALGIVHVELLTRLKSLEQGSPNLSIRGQNQLLSSRWGAEDIIEIQIQNK